MIIDDDYCQYEMWRIVNKAEGDAIAEFEKMKENAGCTETDWLQAIARWAVKTVECKKKESESFSEECVAESAFAQKMTELLTRDMSLVVMVNLSAGTEVHLKDTSFFATMNEEFKGLNYFERCESYAEKVTEKDRERFIETFGFSNIRKQMAAGDIIRASYHINMISGADARIKSGQNPGRAPGQVSETCNTEFLETIYVPISDCTALKLVRVLSAD